MNHVSIKKPILDHSTLSSTVYSWKYLRLTTWQCQQVCNFNLPGVTVIEPPNLSHSSLQIVLHCCIVTRLIFSLSLLLLLLSFSFFWCFVAALCCGHYIFCPVSFYLFSSPNLSSRRLDVDHTSTHDVVLVRILMHVWNVLRAARCKYKTQKNRQKVAIWAPSHNFVALYLRN